MFDSFLKVNDARSSRNQRFHAIPCSSVAFDIFWKTNSIPFPKLSFAAYRDLHQCTRSFLRQTSKRLEWQPDFIPLYSNEEDNEVFETMCIISWTRKLLWIGSGQRSCKSGKAKAQQYLSTRQGHSTIGNQMVQKVHAMLCKTIFMSSWILSWMACATSRLIWWQECLYECLRISKEGSTLAK